MHAASARHCHFNTLFLGLSFSRRHCIHLALYVSERRRSAAPQDFLSYRASYILEPNPVAQLC